MSEDRCEARDVTFRSTTRHPLWAGFPATSTPQRLCEVARHQPENSKAVRVGQVQISKPVSGGDGRISCYFSLWFRRHPLRLTNFGDGLPAKESILLTTSNGSETVCVKYGMSSQSTAYVRSGGCWLDLLITIIRIHSSRHSGQLVFSYCNPGSTAFFRISKYGFSHPVFSTCSALLFTTPLNDNGTSDIL